MFYILDILVVDDLVSLGHCCSLKLDAITSNFNPLNPPDSCSDDAKI